MRRSSLVPIAFALLALAAVAPAASAQYQTPARNVARLEDAIAEPPRPVPGAAALALEHSADLALSDLQRATLDSVRRAQESADAPWVQQLDSLRPTRRPANPNDLSPEQRDEIAARRSAIERATAAMRLTDDAARVRAMAVLTPDQQERVARLEKDARKRAEDERRRRAREGYSRGGMGGGMGGVGRPPEE